MKSFCALSFVLQPARPNLSQPAQKTGLVPEEGTAPALKFSLKKSLKTLLKLSKYRPTVTKKGMKKSPG